MNEQNLKPNSERTPIERKELASKAGRASGKARREKRKIQDALQKALKGTYQIGDTEKGDTEKLGGYDAMAVSMIKAAIGGDVRAFVAIRDTIGEKPKETLEFEDSSLSGIKVRFVNKSNPNHKKEKDPKIVGDYTPPSNTEEE